MDITNRISLALLVFVSALAPGCVSSSPQRSALPAVLTPNGSDAEIAERILVLVPIGTPTETAKRSLLDAGLRCSIESDAEAGQRYLSCGYSDERDFWVTWVWSIRVDCADGVVSGASCKRAGIGL